MDENKQFGFCERCHAKVKFSSIVWLEYDIRTGTYTDLFVPEQYSQGGFVFGADCAEVEKRRHIDALIRATPADVFRMWRRLWGDKPVYVLKGHNPEAWEDGFDAWQSGYDDTTYDGIDTSAEMPCTCIYCMSEYEEGAEQAVIEMLLRGEA
jgi:hypothetical protein